MTHFFAVAKIRKFKFVASVQLLYSFSQATVLEEKGLKKVFLNFSVVSCLVGYPAVL